VNGRRLLALVAVVAAATWLLSGSPATWPIRNARTGHGPIVCFGDSLTAGYGADPDASYPAVLGELLGREVVNEGRNGDTSATAAERLDDVASLEPSVVVITLGGNDMLQRVPIPDTVARMRTIFDRLLSAGAMVAFVAIAPPLTSPARMDAIRDLARAQGVLWIGDAMDGLWTDRSRMADQFHPNAAGYRVMAERVTGALRPHLTR
jgi:lysophospholipase L1-like esterase